MFVLGTYKGGTTAIARLLADACGLSPMLDIPGLWYPVNLKLFRGEVSLATIVQRNARAFAHELVKEPALTFVAAELRTLFPTARFVHVVRDPRDNVRSILDRMELRGDLSSLPALMPRVDERWALLLRPDVWQSPEAHYVSTLATVWTRGVAAYRAHRDTTALIRYEDFVADKTAVIDDLARRLALPRLADISKIADVQYQPLGRHRDVDWQAFFGRANLERIETICAADMRNLGYPTGDAVS